VFAYLLAAVCPTVEAANGLVPCMVITGLFFAGCLLRDVDIPRWWHWASYLDPLRYAFGALMVSASCCPTPLWTCSSSWLCHAGAAHLHAAESKMGLD
jgi:ABC-type multidrug transport system permease subunit